MSLSGYSMGQGAFAMGSPTSRSAGGEVRLMLSQSGASRMMLDEGGGVEHAVGSGTIQGLSGNGALSYQQRPTIAGAVASAGVPGADGCVQEADERRRKSSESGDVCGEAGEGTLAKADLDDPVLFRVGKLTGTVDILRSEVGTLRSEVGALRTEMYSGFGALRGEIGALRTEMHGEIGAVRGEISAVRGEIGAVRDDLSRKMEKSQEQQQSDFKFLIRLIVVGICVPFYLSIFGFLAHALGMF